MEVTESIDVTNVLLSNDTSSQAHHLEYWAEIYSLKEVCPKSMAAKNILAKIVQLGGSGFIEPPS